MTTTNTDPALNTKLAKLAKLHAAALEAQKICRAADFFKLPPALMRVHTANRHRAEEALVRFCQRNALPLPA